MNMRSLLHQFVWFLDTPRIIYDREGKEPYLSRWYLIRSKPEPDDTLVGQPSESNKPRLFDLYLHRFHRSDDDQALHNHPVSWALSFVLAGGYTEERRFGDHLVQVRTVRPFRFNFIRKEDYHRVDLLEEDAWSLFLVGPKIDTWYFWDRKTKVKTHWRRFIEEKRNA